MVGAGGRRRWPRAGGVGFRTGPAMCRTPSTLIPVSRASLARSASATVSAPYLYILRRFTTGSPNDETLWLPNKEMTKPCEVSDETSTNLFPHF
jgi:hypothetical protein